MRTAELHADAQAAREAESATWAEAARLLRQEADAAVSVTTKRTLRRIALSFERKS